MVGHSMRPYASIESDGIQWGTTAPLPSSRGFPQGGPLPWDRPQREHHEHPVISGQHFRHRLLGFNKSIARARDLSAQLRESHAAVYSTDSAQIPLARGCTLPSLNVPDPEGSTSCVLLFCSRGEQEDLWQGEC